MEGIIASNLRQQTGSAASQIAIERGNPRIGRDPGSDDESTVSGETYQLGLAVADLFRRCGRLQEELREQIDRVHATAYRIEGLHGKNADDYRVEGEKEKRREKGKAGLLKRFEDANKRQKELVERYEKLRGQVTTFGGNSLCEKEEQWMTEIYQTRDSLFQPETAKNDENSSREEYSEPWKRFDEVITV